MKENLFLLQDLLELKKKTILQIYDFSIKNVYIDKFADIVHEYNNTHCRTIKLRPVIVDVKLSAYKGFGIKNNDKDSVGLNTC